MTASAAVYAAFVEARLADDDRDRGCQHRTSCGEIAYDGPCDCGVPDRIHRWCVTGRLIVATWRGLAEIVSRTDVERGALQAMEIVIKAMADADRDHPDHPDRSTP